MKHYTLAAAIAVFGLLGAPTLAMARTTTIAVPVSDSSDIVVQHLRNGDVLLHHTGKDMADSRVQKQSGRAASTLTEDDFNATIYNDAE